MTHYRKIATHLGIKVFFFAGGVLINCRVSRTQSIIVIIVFLPVPDYFKQDVMSMCKV